MRQRILYAAVEVLDERYSHSFSNLTYCSESRTMEYNASCITTQLLILLDILLLLSLVKSNHREEHNMMDAMQIARGGTDKMMMN